MTYGRIRMPPHTSAYVCLRSSQSPGTNAYTSAYARIRQHMSYVSIRQHMYLFQPAGIYAYAGLGFISATVCFSSGVLLAGCRWLPACALQHTSAYLSIRQHTSAYVSIPQHTSACARIRQHTSAYFILLQHTSAYVSIRQHTLASACLRSGQSHEAAPLYISITYV